MLRLCTVFPVALSYAVANAEVKMPGIFSNGMILQREQPVRA